MAGFRCTRCDRTFSMAAHLARHMSATHGVGGKRTAKGKGKRKPQAKAARRGRPKGSKSTARFGLRAMPLERLCELITAARTELRNRIAELEQSI
ncbi:MAG: C2H2-type zinc finger protein [bacterium]|nr:C2H2-type zinc finger protein [bacterium]